MSGQKPKRFGAWICINKSGPIWWNLKLKERSILVPKFGLSQYGLVASMVLISICYIILNYLSQFKSHGPWKFNNEEINQTCNKKNCVSQVGLVHYCESMIPQHRRMKKCWSRNIGTCMPEKVPKYIPIQINHWAQSAVLHLPNVNQEYFKDKNSLETSRRAGSKSFVSFNQN